MPSKHILVLEDEPLVAMDLRLAIEDTGCTATVARSNAEALAAIEQGPVSVAILDVTLGDGETCEPSASVLSDRGIPFLLHTGDWNRAGERLRKFGAPVITKPQSSDLVAAKALELADQRLSG